MELLPSTEVIAGAAAMGAIIMAATMAYLAFLPAVSPAMGWWAIATLANGAGLLMPGLWSDAAARPAVAAGQSALALSALLVYAGARRFIYGRIELARLGILFGLLVLAAILWASARLSAPLIPAITALLFLASSWAFGREWLRQRDPVIGVVAIPLTASCAVELLTLLPASDLGQATFLQGIGQLAGLATGVLATAAVMRRGQSAAVEQELQRALDSLQLHEREERMRLAVENERSRLLEVMEGVPQALVLYDAEDHLVFSNTNFGRIFSKTCDLHNPGTSFETIMRASIERSEYGGNREEIEATAERRLAEHHNPTGPSEYTLFDGRTIQVVERKTHDGSTVAAYSDITEYRRRQDALTLIVGNRADGRSFLDAAAHALAVGLGYRCAGIAQRSADGREARILAYWENGQPGMIPSFSLVGAPGGLCYEPGAGTVIIPDGVADRYPADSYLKRAGIVAYQGQAFFGDGGEPLGHIFAMDDKPAPPGTEPHPLLSLIARWVGTESQRLAAERALVAAKEAAEEASRAKTTFLATMSHELRTPLNAIIGFSEIMRDELLGPLGKAQYKTYAEDICQSGGHLLSLINDLLDLSKAGAGKIDLAEEEIEPRNLIESCLRLVETRARRNNVQIYNLVGNPLPRIYADRRRLKQILLNLLANAVKFTPAHGSITVRTRQDMQGFHIEVADTGVGIAAEDIPKVMLPFGQVDSVISRRAEGVGLGLPLSKVLAELHGGRLAIESQLGKGTTVALVLPPARVRAMQAAE
jgi:signal transduction histidine kinase/PAS domain-containing protein